MLLPNNSKGNESGTSPGSSGNNNAVMRNWETGMNMVMDTLSVAAGNTAKDKRAKEASNRSQARGPVIRKARIINPGEISLSSSKYLSSIEISLYFLC